MCAEPVACLVLQNWKSDENQTEYHVGVDEIRKEDFW